MDLGVISLPPKLEDFCETCGHQIVYCVGYKVNISLPMFVASMRPGDISLSIPCFCRRWMSRILGKYIGLVGNKKMQCNVMLVRDNDGFVTHFTDGWRSFISLNGADEKNEAIFYLGKHRIFEVMMISSRGVADTFEDIGLPPLSDLYTRGTMTRLAMRRNILSCYEFEAAFSCFLPCPRRAILHSVHNRGGVFAEIFKTDEGKAVIDNGWSLMIDELNISAGCVCLFQFDVKEKFIHVCVNNLGLV
ncbi:hypothetical protein ACP70R_018169 [Stipagrostis hirtigluma subsp. patula]